MEQPNSNALRRFEMRPIARRFWQALLDGDIDMIATDHSPCPPEMKSRDTGRFDQAWGGIASLGLALPVVWTGLQQRGGGLELLAKWLPKNRHGWPD